MICEKLKLKTSNHDLLEGLDIIINSNNVQKVCLLSDYSRMEDKLR